MGNGTSLEDIFVIDSDKRQTRLILDLLRENLAYVLNSENVSAKKQLIKVLNLSVDALFLQQLERFLELTQAEKDKINEQLTLLCLDYLLGLEQYSDKTLNEKVRKLLVELDEDADLSNMCNINGYYRCENVDNLLDKLKLLSGKEWYLKLVELFKLDLEQDVQYYLDHFENLPESEKRLLKAIIIGRVKDYIKKRKENMNSPAEFDQELDQLKAELKVKFMEMNV